MQKVETGNWKTAHKQEIRNGAERILMDLGSENLLCQLVEVQYGSIGKNHSHPHEQISIILRGSCDYYVDGVPYRLTEGSWIVDPPNAMHYSVSLDPDVPLLILDIFSPSRPEFVESYLKSMKKQPMKEE